MANIDYERLRYAGDARDVAELMETYRVNDYLDAYEENRRQQEESIRGQLLADGIRLTEQLSPRIYSIYKNVSHTIGIESPAEIFCLPNDAINAMAMLDVEEEGTRAYIGLTSGALEKLNDAEIASIMGHELGHFLFKNNRLNALLTPGEDNPNVTVLPALGESLFLRWRKKAEISADRVGLIACGDLAEASRSLMKAAFGLSEKNITLDIDALLTQVDDLKGQPELMEAAFGSHPLLPIRLKALQLFASSEKAQACGFAVQGSLLSDDDLEKQVDELVALTRRHPTEKRSVVAMKTIALGGIEVLSADGTVSDYEIKILIEILHRYFTDEPESEIISDPGEIKRQLKDIITEVNEHCSERDKSFILCRLAEVALADGALMDDEGGVVLQIAEQLGIPARQAYSILVGAAQEVGFNVDVKLNRVAEKLRRSVRIGFGLSEPADEQRRLFH